MHLAADIRNLPRADEHKVRHLRRARAIDIDRTAEWRQRSNELRAQQHLADVEELDDLRPARGMFFACKLTIPFWIVLLIIARVKGWL